MWQDFSGWLSGIISDAMQWLLDLLLWIPKKLWSELLTSISDFFASIPVPDFISGAQNAFYSIPSGPLFFISFFAVKEGIVMVLAALVLRFLTRRIPIIG